MPDVLLMDHRMNSQYGPLVMVVLIVIGKMKIVIIVEYLMLIHLVLMFKFQLNKLNIV